MVSLQRCNLLKKIADCAVKAISANKLSHPVVDIQYLYLNLHVTCIFVSCSRPGMAHARGVTLAKVPLPSKPDREFRVCWATIESQL